jgi:ubiquinone biosynthesis protein
VLATIGLRVIAEVLVRYGLSYVADVVGLERLVGVAHRVVGRAPAAAHTPPRNLRLAFEELGPTFINLGQLLCTRADLVSPDYRAERPPTPTHNQTSDPNSATPSR